MTEEEIYIEELEECLREAIDLMEDTYNNKYKPDSFTTQPWRALLNMEAYNSDRRNN